jgi:hypothetical protein
MNDINAFVDCDSGKGAHRVNLHHYVSGAPSSKPCFTR